MPPDSVLCGILLLTSYCQSHCTISVPGTAWAEPSILWIVIAMPTGSGKTPLVYFFDQHSPESAQQAKHF